MSGDGEDEQYFTAAVIGSVILAALTWIGLILFERPLLMFSARMRRCSPSRSGT